MKLKIKGQKNGMATMLALIVGLFFLNRVEGQTEWGGYSVEAGGSVDTGGKLGWMNVERAPWLYSYSMTMWFFANEPEGSAQGLWMYANVVTPELENELEAGLAISPAGGVYGSEQTVVMTTETSGAEIRYTLDGSEPDENTGTVYTGPVVIAADTTLKVITYKAGMTSSAVRTVEYVISGGREQLLNLPIPEDGTRYDSYAEIEGPVWPSAYGEGQVTLWHHDKFAAYSITIDDNNTPDLDWWLDVSETYGWKFTWFVIIYPYVWDIYNDVPGTNQGYFGTLEEWGDLHALGQDIQLHGACGSMNTLTAAEYEEHVTLSMDLLSEATGAPVETFAYPCGALNNGEEDYREVISRLMVGARGGTGGTTPVHLIDYLSTKNLGVNSLDNGEPKTAFARVYDNTRTLQYSQYRGWGVSLYHGMTTEEVKVNALETFDYVKANEDYFWVAPFTEVSKYAQERESSELTIQLVGSDRIEILVTDDMDDNHFRQPLTVKIRLNSSWTGGEATQNGNVVPVEIVEHEGENYGLVQVVPDQGMVVLEKQ